MGILEDGESISKLKGGNIWFIQIIKSTENQLNKLTIV